MTALEEVERIDAQLSLQSQVEAALRLRLGQALEVIGRGACFDLGFSSLAAYALERCERSVRWVEGARCLARRLEALPALRRAVAFGHVSWSKAILVARVATPGDEARWDEAARRLTVRELAARLKESPASPEGTDELGTDDADDTDVNLACTVDREDAWLFEATRALLSQLGVHGADEQLEALLAEAQITLLDTLPKGTLDLEAWTKLDAAQIRWRERLARWRAEVEVLSEAHLREKREQGGRASTPRNCEAPRGSEHLDGCDPFEQTMLTAALGCVTLQSLTPRELDGVVRKLARALAEHELAFSQRLLELQRVDGWRRLGYASEAHYARERLGMSRSSFIARRALAARLIPPSRAGAPTRAGLPHIAEALAKAQIGVEAAQQLARVATARTEREWLERAEQRTIKHLREEVNAALTAVRLSGQPNCPPPSEAELDEFHELERAASSGRIFEPASTNETSAAAQTQRMRNHEPGSRGQGAWRVTLDSLEEWLARGVQMCAGPAANDPGSASATWARAKGRVALRLRVSSATHSWWRGLEKQARRWLPRGMSWVRFCCLALWRAWRHLLNPDIAYGQIYIRDRHRCASPVCSRRDVTPHHLQFRSAGGSDDDDNVTAVCTWCHLLGIHGGRIRAIGTARQIRWELGRPGEECLVVEGRQRQAA